MAFAFTVSDKAIPKLVMSGFSDQSEYVGQMVMRLQRSGARIVSIRSDGNSLEIRSDCKIPESEVQLLSNLKNSLDAIPYTMALRYFESILISNGTQAASIPSRERISEPFNGTTILLEGRLSGKNGNTYRNEYDYCLEKLIDSDLKINFNSKPLARPEHIFAQEIDYGRFGGKVLIGPGMSGEHFYFQGRKIVEKELPLSWIKLVWHKHPYLPVLSNNELQEDKKFTDEYIEAKRHAINDVINSFLVAHPKPKENQGFIKGMLVGERSKIIELLDDKLIRNLKGISLFNANFEKKMSYNEIGSIPVYESAGIPELVKRIRKGIELNHEDSIVYQALGGNINTVLKQDFDYRIYAQFLNQPSFSAKDMLAPYREVPLSFDIDKKDMPVISNTKVNEYAKKISDFFGLIGLDVRIDTKIGYKRPVFWNSDTACTIFTQNEIARYVFSKMDKDEEFGSLLVHSIASHYFSVPKNQHIEGMRFSPLGLVNTTLSYYFKAI